MPYKHQMDCYRNFNGKRYENAGDVPDRSEAVDLADEYRADGFSARIVKQDSGSYYSVFVDAAAFPPLREPDELEAKVLTQLERFQSHKSKEPQP